ncbi:MAG: hypothetical protein QE271_11685 [Bacteriovoracaceae bacterium]|nr:hypothetical protein [Bacteriovoracaceae bacterium]
MFRVFFSLITLPFFLFSCSERSSTPSATSNSDNLIETDGGVDFVYVAGADVISYIRKDVQIGTETAPGGPGNLKTNTPPVNNSVVKCYLDGKNLAAPDALLFDPLANDYLSGYNKGELVIGDLQASSKLSVVTYNGTDHLKLPTACDSGVTTAEYLAGNNQNFSYNIYYREVIDGEYVYTLLDSGTFSIHYRKE